MTKPIAIWFTDFWHEENEAAIRQNDLYRLLDKHFPLALDRQSPDFVIYSDVGDRFRSFTCTRIYCGGENVRPDFSECDFAFSFDNTDERNFRFPPYLIQGAEEGRGLLTYMSNQRRDVADMFADKTQFCNFIYHNPDCGERNHFQKLLSRYKKVDSAGRVFHDTPGLAPRDPECRPEDKISFIRNYKFTIAFENESHPGYTTEKIFHPSTAGSVPIYWGNPHIAREFNPASFINCHDFPSFQDVVKKVVEIDMDDDEYKKYLSASPFIGENIIQAELEKALARFQDIFSCPLASPVAQSTWNRSFGVIPRSFSRRMTRNLRRKRKRLQYNAALLIRTQRL